MTTPMLSIGMIFRNDIRSLERCLKALEPLRRAIPCELVMADTGSTDGSRAVAERYADILFDFPWVNDFSAARNAVMDRCTGTWYFSVDSDEYLDPDVSQLVNLIASGHWEHVSVGLVVQRNYRTDEMDPDGCTDFMAVRLLRMSTGLRFQGAIHECWHYQDEDLEDIRMPGAILHHDGYVDLNGERGRDKLERNLTLLREELKQEPESLRRLIQYIDSGRHAPDYWERLKTAMELVKQKKPGWEVIGPQVYRSAVGYAYTESLPQLEEWLEEAWSLFPDSYFTRIDTAYVALLAQWSKEDYPGCMAWGEAYMRACRDFSAEADPTSITRNGPLSYADGFSLRTATLLFARCHLMLGDAAQCIQLLRSVQLDRLNEPQMEVLVKNLRELHYTTWEDTAPLVTALWECLRGMGPKGQSIAEKFYQTAAVAFAPDVRRAERENSSFCRCSYTMLLPLKDSCVLGVAAALLETTDRSQLEQLLCQVEQWDKLPVAALEHALDCGVSFPPPDRPLNLEEMIALADRMPYAREERAIQAAEGDLHRWQSLAWAQALALAAVRSCTWEDEAKGLALSRAFAKIEAVFLSRYYAPDLRKEDNLQLLPPLHRLGWYCVQAFQALDAGRAADYAKYLRKSLVSCESMQPMVEFLSKHTPALQTPKPNEELLALAEQVRALLAAYDPADPAVAAVKASEAYRSVAHLIEGVPAGGLPS